MRDAITLFSWVPSFAGICLVLGLTSCGRSQPDPVQVLSPISSRQGQSDIFAQPQVLRVEIEIPKTGISALRRTQWGEGGSERPTVRATVKEGGVVYTSVAVHLKGAAGSFRPVDDLPAMTLNFDKFV